VKFLDLFEQVQKGNFGLTDEAIYKSIQRGGNFIPIWGAYKEHIIPDRFVSENGNTKSNDSIRIYEGEGIIINFDGVSAGRMTFKRNEKFALNHHTGFFKVKNTKKSKIDPEYFSIFYQNQLQDISVSTGSSTLGLDQLYKIDFETPEYDSQITIMKTIKPLLVLKRKLNLVLDEVNQLKSMFFSQEYTHYQTKNIPISIILQVEGGNSGLTEEFLYSQLQYKVSRNYRVLTGSIDFSGSKFIHKCRNPKNPDELIKTVENKPVIHVVRKGKAGSTSYFEKGSYTTNDDAYIIFLKETNFEINLKWLMYQLKPEFIEYSSSSDNGTWNKTGFFKNVTIDLPDIKEQNKVAEKYEQLENLEKKLISALTKINELLRKQISVPMIS